MRSNLLIYNFVFNRDILEIDTFQNNTKTARGHDVGAPGKRTNASLEIPPYKTCKIIVLSAVHIRSWDINYFRLLLTYYQPHDIIYRCLGWLL